MRKAVYDIENLQQAHPIFKNKIIAFLMKKLMAWLSFDKVNQIHSNHCHLRGAELTSAMLADPLMDVKYTIHHKERLDSLPEGAFVTVSNHPIGSLDGIILVDIFASRRKDFKMMVNGILVNVGAMADNFISVQPRTTDQKTKINPSNINGVKAALGWLKDGHPVGFFPAGAMSFLDKNKQAKDRAWTHSAIRLIRKVKLPVYPVYFACQNSRLFYWLGKIHWKIRTLRAPEEAFNKRGKTLDIYIGNPIPPQTVQQYTDDTELADFLYQSTYNSCKS